MDPLLLPQPIIDPSAYVAASAQLHGQVTVGPDAVIMFGVVVRAEFDVIRIGARTNIQDNSVLHCDEGIPCRIGDDVTVGHAAVVHGADVGDHCLVGIGARVLDNSVMGEGSWLAAGSVLPEGKSIPDWTLAMGIPAKPVRELTADEIERQADGVATYQRLAAAYRDLNA
ncbi:MAG: gamma carbonic anhydrase family protein [Acidimicrobiia bacterium]|nr:gamma carbonic anhydrase family protein [Acidimicrobiia bacterium]MDH5502809.1 gamma carbonic anhydrase family protein [Acidimicrobiia bacterium]